MVGNIRTPEMIQKSRKQKFVYYYNHVLKEETKNILLSYQSLGLT